MIQPVPDFAAQYAEWLTSRLSTTEYDGITELSTPILDPFNDGMRVYVQPNNGGFIIHDNGITLETLSLFGADIHSTTRRTSITNTVLNTCGLTIEGDRIQTLATKSNLPQRMHFLLCAMQRISDLWQTVRSPSGSNFFEHVCSYLDEKDVLYTTNLAIPGKTVQHPIDIVIPLPKRRERLVKLISTPNTNMAKVVSFSWIEIQQVRPDAERVVLINDESSIDKQETKRVSEQTEAILRGYSNNIFFWSMRDKPGFEKFWLAA